MIKIDKIRGFSKLKKIGIEEICLQTASGNLYSLTDKRAKKVRHNNSCLPLLSSMYTRDKYYGHTYMTEMRSGTVFYKTYEIALTTKEENDKLIADIYRVTELVEKKFDTSSFSAIFNNNVRNNENLFMHLKTLKNPLVDSIVDFLKIYNYLQIRGTRFNTLMDTYTKLFDLKHLKEYEKEILIALLYLENINNSVWGNVKTGGITKQTTPKSLYMDANDLPAYIDVVYPYILMAYYEKLSTSDQTVPYWKSPPRGEEFMKNINDLNCFTSMDPRLIETIKVSLENRLIQLTDLSRVSMSINNNLSLIDDVDKFLEYVHFNNYRSLLEISEEYIEVVKFNRAHGIKLSNPVLFSFEYALERLKEDGYDPVSVEIFGEMIDLDPIEALSVIQNKRKLSNKRQKCYAERLIEHNAANL